MVSIAWRSCPGLETLSRIADQTVSLLDTVPQPLIGLLED